MKTILYMSITANGRFARTDGSHSVPPEIMADLSLFAKKTGNLVSGRKTYERLRNMKNQHAFAGVELVAVSRSPNHDASIKYAGSPRAALDHLERKGFATVIIGGGAETDCSFLSAGLIDEVILNIEPFFLNAADTAVIDETSEASLRLIRTSTLGNNIVQLHYQVTR